MKVVKHETCLEYFNRRLSEGWRLISLGGYNAVLLSPDGIRRELDLRRDVETLRPNAAGDETTLNYYGAGANWECVNEVEPDEYATQVYKTADPIWRRDLYKLPASSGSGTINKITVYTRTKIDPGTIGDARPAIKSNTTVTDGTVYHPQTWWDTYSQEWATNPADWQAWEWADIDNLQIGVSLRDPYSLTNVRCTQVYVEVDYTAIIIHEKTVTDGIALTDTLVKAPIKTFSDGIALTDVLVKSPIKTLVDGIALSDVWEGYKLKVRELIDGIAFTDALARSTGKVITDGIEFGDVLVKRLERVLADGIKFTDTLVKATSKTLTDAIAFSDVVTRYFEQVFSDGIKFTDTLWKVWTHGVLRILKAVRNLPSIREDGTKR
ncbi:hypothetical protein ES708_12767 [subsurface metagenome]